MSRLTNWKLLERKKSSRTGKSNLPTEGFVVEIMVRLFFEYVGVCLGVCLMGDVRGRPNDTLLFGGVGGSHRG
jgi:hypothetical protein